MEQNEKEKNCSKLYQSTVQLLRFHTYSERNGKSLEVLRKGVTQADIYFNEMF